MFQKILAQDVSILKRYLGHLPLILLSSYIKTTSNSEGGEGTVITSGTLRITKEHYKSLFTGGTVSIYAIIAFIKKHII